MKRMIIQKDKGKRDIFVYTSIDLLRLEGVQDPGAIVGTHLNALGVRGQEGVKEDGDVEDQVVDAVAIQELVLARVFGLAFALASSVVTDGDLMDQRG
jgi:hypothetical protein